MIFGNDSIVNRRIIRSYDVKSLYEITSESDRPCLVGELDTMRVSVPINGRSSSAWVSSYLFGLKLGTAEAKQVSVWLKQRSATIEDCARDAFAAFLEKRRPDITTVEGKLSAMYLERLLSEYAASEGFEIVNQYAGNWGRKVRKLMEAHFR